MDEFLDGLGLFVLVIATNPVALTIIVVSLVLGSFISGLLICRLLRR